MKLEEIITPTTDTVMIVISTRNRDINEAIWKPFIKKKEYINRDFSILDAFNFVKNNYPDWSSFFWRGLDVIKN